MATILNNQKSTGSSPYAYYTVTATASNRTTYGVTISGTISAHLASDSSSLQQGPTMGLNAFLTLNGVEQSAVNLKATDVTWSGKTNHNTNYSFTISNLQPTQTSVPISFRVSRTGSAANNYSKGAALKSTDCSDLAIEQGVAQSDFTYISNPTYNGTFSCTITSYSGYDVLEIKNGSTVIQTYNGVTNGTAYSFNSTAQSTILGLIGSSNSSVSLTARLTTYTASGGTSLGYTDRTITVSLPAYTPTITLSSYSDGVSTYNTYKNNATDIIKSLSKPTIVVTLSNNYNNVYNSAVCNSTQGTINGRTVTFSNVTQADNYSIGVTDTRGKYSRIDVSGNSYTASIKTVQWYKGSLTTKVVRPTPTGSTATVTVTPNVYDGTNLKSSALRAVAFTFKYTESGSSEVTVQSSSFTQSGNSYTYTIQNLDYTKTVAWSISGTDKIGVATNGDSNTLQIGMPVWNAYKTSTGVQAFKVNGNERVKGDLIVDNMGTFNGILKVEQNDIYNYLENSYGFAHYTTNGANGHWFNTNVKVQGNVYAGSNYDLKLAYDRDLWYNGIAAPSNNLNNAIHNGCYYWVDNTSNRPSISLYGWVLTTNSSGIEHNNTDNWCSQLGFGTDGNVYTRCKINSGGWSNWRSIYETHQVTFNGEWLSAVNAYGAGWTLIIPFENPLKKQPTLNLTSHGYFGTSGWVDFTSISIRSYTESFVMLYIEGINSASGNTCLVNLYGTLSI